MHRNPLSPLSLNSVCISFLQITRAYPIFRSPSCPTDQTPQGTQCNSTSSSQLSKAQFQQLCNIHHSIRRVRCLSHRFDLTIHPVTRNPVRAAYLASLESQISSLRDELATVYKTQGQNAQRLLAMNETLREKEELARIDTESLRRAKDELAALKRRVDQHAEVMQEKDRTVQVCSLRHFESLTLSLMGP